MNEADEYEEYTSEQLAEWVLENDGIDGVTLSGGEPFEQPIDLVGRFLTIVKRKPSLSVVSYTGRYYDELVENEENRTVLQYIDVLIDGEYRYEEDFGQRWRGSANQRFHFLTDRYLSQQDEWNNAVERQIEMELDINGKLLFSGVTPKDFIKKLTAALHRQDVDIDFS